MRGGPHARPFAFPSLGTPRGCFGTQPMQRIIRILVAVPPLAARGSEFRAALCARRPAWDLDFSVDPGHLEDSLSAAPADVVLLECTHNPAEVATRLRACHPDVGLILVADTSRVATVRELLLSRHPPDGALFLEELRGDGGADVLEEQVVSALCRRGRVENPTGVLVTHGTDTLAWGFAYLRYALKDLTANVAVTGSQIPLEGHFSDSDALGNLKTSVLLLNRLRPARLFAVFNDGRSVFTGRLTKYRKWDADAFEGRMALSAGRAGLHAFRSDWARIPYEDQKLEELHLLRTGGTIESRRSGLDGALRPTGDFVWEYLHEALADQFSRAVRHDLFALDSSNMSLEHWASVAREIESTGVARADTRFDPSVKPVVTNPLFTTEDYRAQFRACGAGAILAGYGGGNANVLEGSPHALLPALRASAEAGTFVAVTSQVPLEPYDAEYETGLKLLEAGGVPCGDLPLADAQVKLSYLLGHSGELEAAALAAGIEPGALLTAAFLSGVSMRKASTLDALRSRLGGRLPALLPEDPFAGRPFEEALAPVVRSFAR